MESGLPSNVCFDLPMSPLRWSSSSHSSLLVTWICHWKLSTRFLPAAILRRAATPPDAFSIADGSEWTKCNGNASVNQMGSIQLTQAEATGSLRILGSTEWRRTRMWRMFHASIKRRRRAFLIRSCHDQDHRRGGGGKEVEVAFHPYSNDLKFISRRQKYSPGRVPPFFLFLFCLGATGGAISGRPSALRSSK